MRRRLGNVSPAVRAAALLFVACFALFAVTTQRLTGYEPETGAVTEGLVLEGHFWDDESSTLPLKADIPGKGGHFYSRTGILQPLLEAPFFAVGHLADNTFGYFSTFPNAYTFLWFYNPFVAALAAVALFALVFQARRSLRWATTIATLFALASVAWPYSKIGMETTFMFAAMTAFALAFWARRSPSVLSWGLTGLRDRRRGRDQGLRAGRRAADRDPALAGDDAARGARESCGRRSPCACPCCSGSA